MLHYIDEDRINASLTTIIALAILKMIKAGNETSRPPAKPREPGKV